MNKKRNVFFIIILLLTCIFGFSYISFSYYTGVSNEVENVNIVKIDNELTIDGYEGTNVVLKPNETKSINLIVKSLNPIKTSYKLFYESDKDVLVNVVSVLPDRIDAKDKQLITVSLTNESNEENNIKFNIYSNYLGREIIGHGEEIKK